MILKRAQESYEAMDEGREARWEVVERILFIYAKLNPGQGYVQGMNEIIGPIYYVMASDSNIEYRGQWIELKILSFSMTIFPTAILVNFLFF